MAEGKIQGKRFLVRKDWEFEILTEFELSGSNCSYKIELWSLTSEFRVNYRKSGIHARYDRLDSTRKEFRIARLVNIKYIHHPTSKVELGTAIVVRTRSPTCPIYA